MKDVLLPFFPSKTSDHLIIKFEFTVTAGLEDVESVEQVHGFLKIMKSQIESTGVLIEDWWPKIQKLDPYVGSQREKLLYDANCGSEKEKSE